MFTVIPMANIGETVTAEISFVLKACINCFQDFGIVSAMSTGTNMSAVITNITGTTAGEITAVVNCVEQTINGFIGGIISISPAEVTTGDVVSIIFQGHCENLIVI